MRLSLCRRGTPAPPGSIIEQPELQVYIANFGKEKDDIGLVAEVGEKIVGAVWVRIMNDYGHIDDDTPSFAISVYPAYRGFGIGTALRRRCRNRGLRDILNMKRK